jgi:16S rRNA G966 N2-methylase RsmD
MTALDVFGGTAQSSIEKADALAWLSSLPEQSVDLLFASPPYEKARLYLEDGADLNIARDTEQWVAWMVELTHAALRVCKGLVAWVVEGQTSDYRYSCGPALLMADLCRAGVCLRKPPIYRRVGIPGSGGPDWMRNDYEFIVCATNGGRLEWSNNKAMGHKPKYGPGGELSYRALNGERVNVTRHKTKGTSGYSKGDTMTHKPGTLDRKITDIANPGNVVQEIYTAADVAEMIAEQSEVVDCIVGGGKMGSKLAHEGEAPFPERLAEFFIRSFCPEGGIVADCFSGSGTTGAVALRWGRRFVGCDLRQSQVDLTTRRLKGEANLFDSVEDS